MRETPEPGFHVQAAAHCGCPVPSADTGKEERDRAGCDVDPLALVPESSQLSQSDARSDDSDATAAQFLAGSVPGEKAQGSAHTGHTDSHGWFGGASPQP